MCENNRPHLKSRSIDRAKFSLVTIPTEMRLIRESVIILKNWLKILLRLIREGEYIRYVPLYRFMTSLKNINT